MLLVSMLPLTSCGKSEAPGLSSGGVGGNEGGTSAQIILPRLEGAAELEVRCRPVTYGAGVDPLLVELSTVLDASLYRKKP